MKEEEEKRGILGDVWQGRKQSGKPLS